MKQNGREAGRPPGMARVNRPTGNTIAEHLSNTTRPGGSFLGTTTLAFACLWISSGMLCAAPDVTRSWFSPPVVPQGHAQPVRFQAMVTESPARVDFEYNGVDRPMYDDGTHGDLIAADGTWTILFQPSEILGKLTPDRVFRPFIGFCKPAGSGKFNTFAEVWTPEIGLVDVQAINSAAQASDYLVNFVASTSQLLSFDDKYWARQFYAKYPDDFDFLNFLLIGGRRGNRYHVHVKNNVLNIGIATFDNTALFGSAGRLQGYNYFPLSGFFDAATDGFSHETGHQWINFLAGTAFASGIPHWPKGDVAINVMGFSISGPERQGGTFGYTFTPSGQGGYVVGPHEPINNTTFNRMELYLMGLIRPDEVGTFFVLKRQDLDLTVGQVLQPSDVTLVGVNDVIAAVGARVPDSSSSQKTFRCATVVLSEQLLDVHALSFYDWFARRAEGRKQVAFAQGFSTGTCNPFYLATGGRAVMLSRIRNIFHRGDPNDDGLLDVSDAISVLGFLFTGGVTIGCKETADADNDGRIDISDGVFLVTYAFLGGPPPLPPGPPGSPCGSDTDAPGSMGDLGCDSYSVCR